MASIISLGRVVSSLVSSGTVADERDVGCGCASEYSIGGLF